MIVVNYAGRPVAFAWPARIEFSRQVMALEADHPHRRWALCLGIFALDIADGLINGPYSDFRAALFARQALVPDDEFTGLDWLDDARLAEHFNVPLAEISEKRIDLEAAAYGHAARRIDDLASTDGHPGKHEMCLRAAQRIVTGDEQPDPDIRHVG